MTKGKQLDRTTQTAAIPSIGKLDKESMGAAIRHLTYGLEQMSDKAKSYAEGMKEFYGMSYLSFSTYFLLRGALSTTWLRWYWLSLSKLARVLKQ